MPDPLLDDPEHGGVTDDDIANFFNTHPGLRPLGPLNSGADPTLPLQFQSGAGRMAPPAGGVEEDDLSGQAPPPAPSPAESAQSAPSDAGSGDQGGGGDATQTPPPPTAEFVDFDGTQIPATRLRALLALADDIDTDPQLRSLITSHVVGRGAAVEGGAPATAPVVQPAAGEVSVPEGLDLEDPAIAALWSQVQQTNQALQTLQATTQTTHDAMMQQRRADATAHFNAAAESFKSKYAVTDEDIVTLSNVAGRLGVVPALMQGTDPLTGLPSRPDPIAVAERALEIAYYTHPDYRAKAFAQSVHQQQEDAAKKQKLAAVGGSNGSAQRVQATPRPGTPEARSAMLAEVGQMMTGEWTGDNN